MILALLSSFAFGNNFGEYKYSKYLGIQQQIRTQQMVNLRRQRMYNQNPMRNIRYSNNRGEYPNIERNYRNRYYNANRYSPQYYQMRYNSQGL